MTQDLFEEVEKYIQKFLEKYKERCDEIRKEGWLGEEWPRGQSGLLGYMRTSYALQIAIFNKLSGAPIYPTSPTIVNFFRSDFFKESVLNNGKVTDFFKKEHFEILKKEQSK